MTRLIVIQSDPVAESVRRAGCHPNVLGKTGRETEREMKMSGEERDRERERAK